MRGPPGRLDFGSDPDPPDHIRHLTQNPSCEPGPTHPSLVPPTGGPGFRRGSVQLLSASKNRPVSFWKERGVCAAGAAHVRMIENHGLENAGAVCHAKPEITGGMP